MPTNALTLFEDNAHNVAASMHPPQTIFLPNIGSFAILHPRLDLIILHCAILIFQSLYFHINFTRKIYISIYSYFLLCYLMDGLHHSRMGVQALGPEAKPETRAFKLRNEGVLQNIYVYQLPCSLFIGQAFSIMQNTADIPHHCRRGD